jgi:hypothetical protein
MAWTKNKVSDDAKGQKRRAGPVPAILSAPIASRLVWVISRLCFAQ